MHLPSSLNPGEEPPGGLLVEAAALAAAAIPDDEGFAKVHDSAHRMVRALYADYRDGPLENAMLAWRLLGARFPRHFSDEQWAAAAGLIEYHRQTGRMGGGLYDVWVREQPLPHPYFSKGRVKRVLGPLWKDVLRNVFGQPARDLAALSLNATGRTFTDDLLERAITTWSDEHDTFCDCRLTQDCFLQWGAAEMAKTDPRFTHLPATGMPFRRWDGWRATLLRFDLLERRRQRPNGTRAVSVIAARKDWYVDERLHEALAMAAGVLSLDMGALRYQRWVDAQVELALAEGRMLVLPHHRTILHRYKHWPKALHAAGLISELQMHVRMRQTRRTDDELVDGLIAAMLEYGTGLSPAQYRYWRDEEVRKAKADGYALKLGTQPTVRDRLGRGDWEDAKDAARKARPEITIPETDRPPTHPGPISHARKDAA